MHPVDDRGGTKQLDLSVEQQADILARSGQHPAQSGQYASHHSGQFAQHSGQYVAAQHSGQYPAQPSGAYAPVPPEADDELPEPTFWQRHPVVGELFGKERKLPYVQQATISDCGVACLTSVLNYLGKDIRLSEVREVLRSDKDGSGAEQILRSAQWFGLRGRPVSLDVEDLDLLPRGAILHWNFSHWVVFDRLERNAVRIVDPAAGHRRVPLAEFGQSFTGVALILEPTDAFVRHRSKSRPALELTRAILKSYPDVWFKIITTSMGLQLLALAVPVLTVMVMDRVVPQNDASLLWVLTAGFGLMTVFHIVTHVLRGALLVRMRAYLDSRLTAEFVEHMLSLPYKFFQTRPPGDLIERVQALSNIRMMLTTTTVATVLDGSFMALYLLLILAVSPFMGGVVILVGLLHVMLVMLVRGPVRERYAEFVRKRAAVMQHGVETLSGISHIKVSGTESLASQLWINRLVTRINAEMKAGRLEVGITGVLESLRVAAPIAVLLVGAVQVMDGKLQLSTMLGLSALSVGFLSPLTSLVQTVLQFYELGGDFERLDDVLSATPEQNVRQRQPAPPLSGEVVLDNVTLRYGALGKPAVQGLSLRIPAGTFAAIVGPSGAGKSTIASLIGGLYAPTEGRVVFDGYDLQQLELSSLRRQIGFVPQDPHIIGSTIARNISAADRELDMDEVVAAAKLAHIHEHIEGLPMGYKTKVLFGGGALSGGEKQRVMIARALVNKPRILVLDEATSALDSLTEVKVQESIAALGCTRIAVAHRLSTIRDADVILVLDQGRLVEQGSHDELVARRGLYYRMLGEQALQEHQGEVRRRQARAAPQPAQ